MASKVNPVERVLELKKMKKDDLEAVAKLLGETPDAAATIDDLVAMIMKHDKSEGFAMPTWAWPFGNILALVVAFILLGVPGINWVALAIIGIALVIDLVVYFRQNKPSNWAEWQQAIKDNIDEVAGLVALPLYVVTGQPVVIMFAIVVMVLGTIAELKFGDGS